MNLPPFPGSGVRIADLGEYLKARLSLDTVPWPDHAWRLLTHMAWPNDASRRDLWMAAQIGMQLDPAKPADGEGASAGDTGATPPYLPAQNASWEYFTLFGGHAPLARFASAALHDEIGKIQIRWARVAAILHLHYDMTAGNHMKKRGGASHTQGNRFDSGAIPQQGAQRCEFVDGLDGVQGRCSSRHGCCPALGGRQGANRKGRVEPARSAVGLSSRRAGPASRAGHRQIVAGIRPRCRSPRTRGSAL
jgi:hypothetical protein